MAAWLNTPPGAAAELGSNATNIMIKHIRITGIGSDESFASSNGLLLLPARLIEERGEKRGNNACEESGNGQLGQLALRLINFVLTASTPVDCLGIFFRRCSVYSLA
uniref:Uncharacterized protein n=1 Tax=Opuntia streptacantha TaxID=393608 RepID=A0A7C9EEF5_OPUST